MMWWIVTVLACIACFGLGILVGRGPAKGAWTALKDRTAKTRQRRTSPQVRADPAERLKTSWWRRKRDKHAEMQDRFTAPTSQTPVRPASLDEGPTARARPLLPEDVAPRVAAARELYDPDSDLTVAFDPYAQPGGDAAEALGPSADALGGGAVASAPATGGGVAPLKTPKAAREVTASPRIDAAGSSVPVAPGAQVQGPAQFSVTVRSVQSGIVSVVFSSGQTWLAHEVPGLAVDMHLRATPKGDLLVSVRTPHSGAFITLGQEQLILADVEIPWQAGAISNGDVTFEWEPAQQATSDLSLIRMPSQPNTAQIRMVRSWLAIAPDRPDLALAGAHLFLPYDLDPIGEWRRRLRLYLGEEDAQVGLVAIIEGRLLISEVPELGIGTSRDTLPGTLVTSADAFSPTMLDSSQLLLWVPVVTGEDRWSTGSFVIRRETVPVLQR